MKLKRDLAILLQRNDFSMACKTDLKHPKHFHSHPGYELVWLQDGAAQYIFEDKIYPMAKDSLLVFKSSSLHKVHVPEGRKYARVVIQFTRNFFGFEHEALEEFQRILERMSAPHTLLQLQAEAAGALRGIVERLMAENAGDDTWGKKGAIQIHLLELLLFLCRSMRRETGVGDRLDRGTDKAVLTENILLELNAAWNTNWSLDALASRLHMNKFYLCHFFKKELGVTIQQYILQKRFHEAQKLLINTDLPIREVASRVGFVSDSNFIRGFKKHLNTTPKLFRESAEAQHYKL
ncbi:helix-turn-helix domain-containing protein [Paenibacillus xanthanilyticus]|uniref:AraC family transcriptional regulator n=1 Tax=Paenibacillus xanthanilyticus TaxID=1783531 RepID=A0ABV8K688_9BACL